MLSGDCNVCINRELPSNSATCVECGLSRKNYKPMTNADRIRSMSDEELAEFVIGVLCYTKLPYMEIREKALRDNELIDWLEQEVKDDKG